MGKFFWKTEQGQYDLGEVLSALQKEIRRGNEFEALYWADECCPKFAKAMWKRLVVISHEDIGIANPQAQFYTAMCRDQWMEWCKDGKPGSARMMLANCILLLCRSDKSRLADHLQTALRGFREVDLKRLEIPDYALDLHTKRGQQKRRGWQHFQEHGAVLHNKVPLQGDEEYERLFCRFKPLLEKIKNASPTAFSQEDLFEQKTAHQPPSGELENPS